MELPPRLDYDCEEDWLRLLGFVGRLRDAALSGEHKKITLDFSDVETLSVEAAVLLVAEIHRCSSFLGRRTQITGTYPRDPAISSLLTEIGFFKALDIREPLLPKSYAPVTFVQIERGNRTDAELANRLLDCFTHVFAFEPADRRRLHVALIECMDNVYQHAYAEPGRNPYLLNEWWLVGFADEASSTISFTFYDQGAGIPTTIRRKQHKRIADRLRHWNDAKWLERAVQKGVSRLSSKRRGYGLTKLNEFVRELQVIGSLTVVSNLGAVIFPSTSSVRLHPLSVGLKGTLVTWQLTGISNIQVSDATHDHIADVSLP
ncbi:hypothetical protein [Luteimonas changyuni]|uniref:hypothetical protein n=1 Tax=Luteimonas sp. MJ145 TaxID=3129234 RepID=UPI0031BB0810